MKGAIPPLAAAQLVPRSLLADSYDTQAEAESAAMVESGKAVTSLEDPVAASGLRVPAVLCEVWHIDNDEEVFAYLATYLDGDPVDGAVSALRFVTET